MAAKRSNRPTWHRRLSSLFRIRTSPKREAAAKREALKVFGVIAVAAIVGFAVARLWLPATSRQEARLAEIAPAAGSPEGAHTPVDLSSAKWNLPPEAHKSDSLPPSTVQPSQSPASPAWMRFASAAPETNGRPMVAIVIDDVGVDRRRSARAIELPATVTLAFLPYAEDVADQVRIAKQSGHELLVHMPMEALDSTQDPGPNALMTEIPDDELLRRLHWNLDRFDGYVGVNNHMGSRFTRDRHGMELVMNELKARGLLFLDSKTIPDSVGEKLAHEMGVPTAARQVFLDNDQNAEEVEQRLAETERVARMDGFAVAIGHPHDGTLEALKAWLPRMQADGIVLVPLSAIVRHQMTAGGNTAQRG
jgi:polysaccharide deacetylase 2 family uncharacterized protein YibQ